MMLLPLPKVLMYLYMLLPMELSWFNSTLKIQQKI